MNPLVALGLPLDADERAVKRAYAQRLKSARPDEDARAFQDLRELYEAALAWVRVRHLTDAADAAKQAAEPAAPAERADAASTIEGETGPGESAGGDDGPERFSLDLGAFLVALGERIRSGDARALPAWLARETADWPWAARSTVAWHVLRYVHDETPEIGPKPLEAVIAAFGADDVLSGCDPLAVEMLRRRAVELGDLSQRRATVSALLEPGSRDALADHMSALGGSRSVTRFAAHILTARRARTWARFASRAPFVTGRVTGFLRRLDDGRLQALSPAIAPDVVEAWSQAEARNARSFLSPGLVFLGLLALVYLFAHSWNDGPIQDAREIAVIRIVEEGNAQLAAGTILSVLAPDGQPVGDLDKAVRSYDKVIHDPELVVTPAIEHAVARAYYNKGLALERAQKTEAAGRAYDDLARAADGFQNAAARQLVVTGLVSRGRLALAAGALDTAYGAYANALAKGETNPDASLAPQIAMALLGQATALARKGDETGARERCDEVIGRFAGSSHGGVKETLSAARKLKLSLGGGRI